MKYSVLLLTVLSLSLFAQDEQSQFGSVSGRVLGADEQPLAGAIVTARGANEGRVGLGASATTDKQGNFLIPRARAGVDWLVVSKEADGYPNTVFSFYSGPNPVRSVRVEKQSTTADVVIQMNAKAGTVDLMVTDNAGTPVPNPGIRMHQLGYPDRFVATKADQNGRLTSLVPSVPVGIVVSAPGYADWDSVTSWGPLLVPSESKQSVHIVLKRVAER